LPEKSKNKVDFYLTMWYSTVQPLKSEILQHIFALRTEGLPAAELPGFLFEITYKYVKFLRQNLPPYGETAEMNTNIGKMQDCACFFSDWAVYLLYVNILLPFPGANIKLNAAGSSQPKL